MPINPITVGSFVSLGSHPIQICCVDKINDDGSFIVIKANGDYEKVLHISPFFDYDTDASFITYCSLCLGYAFKNDIGKQISVAIGKDMKKINERKAIIARTILICNDISPIVTHRALGLHYEKALNLSKKLISLDGDKKIIEDKKPLAGAWVCNDVLPEDTHPLRGEEDTKIKDLGYLKEGVLPSLKTRTFYTGIFELETGLIERVKTYQDTGFGQLNLLAIWGQKTYTTLEEGLSGLFYIYSNKHLYIRWPLEIHKIPLKSYHELQKQITLASDHEFIFEIWEELPHEDGKPIMCERRDIHSH